jgi:hypothetical protein
MLSARVSMKGNRTRIETRLSDQPVVFLYASPYLYKLLPSSRVGVRWRADRTSQGKTMANFNVQTLLRDPSMIRTALRQAGARRARQHQAERRTRRCVYGAQFHGQRASRQGVAATQ